jgi:hypothetical protein
MLAVVLCVSLSAIALAEEPKASRTTFSASALQVADGDAVTLKASVSALRPDDGVPTGTVEFFDGATSLGTADLAAVDGGAEAQLTLTLALGPHPITVQYAGDTTFGGSVSVPSFVLVVGR